MQDFRQHFLPGEGGERGPATWVKRYPTALNRSRLTRQTHLCDRQMSKAKSAHHSEIITEHSGDNWSLWKTFTKIPHHCSKFTSLIIPLLTHYQPPQQLFVHKTNSPAFVLLSPLTHACTCGFLLIPGRSYRT